MVVSIFVTMVTLVRNCFYRAFVKNNPLCRHGSVECLTVTGVSKNKAISTSTSCKSRRIFENSTKDVIFQQ